MHAGVIWMASRGISRHQEPAREGPEPSVRPSLPRVGDRSAWPRNRLPKSPRRRACFPVSSISFRAPRPLLWRPIFGRSSCPTWFSKSRTKQADRHLRNEGLYRGAAKDLRKRLGKVSVGQNAAQLGKDLTKFVAAEAKQLRRGERLPACSEVIETCFGKFKTLEREQVKGGVHRPALGTGRMRCGANSRGCP